MMFSSAAAWVCIPALPLIRCVDVGKSFGFLEPCISYLTEFLCRLNKLLKVKCLKKKKTWCVVVPYVLPAIFTVNFVRLSYQSPREV